VKEREALREELQARAQGITSSESETQLIEENNELKRLAQGFEKQLAETLKKVCCYCLITLIHLPM